VRGIREQSDEFLRWLAPTELSAGGILLAKWKLHSARRHCCSCPGIGRSPIRRLNASCDNGARRPCDVAPAFYVSRRRNVGRIAADAAHSFAQRSAVPRGHRPTRQRERERHVVRRQLPPAPRRWSSVPFAIYSAADNRRIARFRSLGREEEAPAGPTTLRSLREGEGRGGEKGMPRTSKGRARAASDT